jgi:hypothetical protein
MRSAWEIVADYVESAYTPSVVRARVIMDLRTKFPHVVTLPPTQLTQAYSLQIQAATFLASKLDAHNVGPESPIDADRIPDQKLRWHLLGVQQIFASQVRALVQLRTLLEEHHQ